nr:tyrosine-type recombinase/integrase [Sporosarcina limicola]
MSTTNTCSLPKLVSGLCISRTNNELGTITTHGLRHTHCSLLFEAGASLKQVQDRLGHTDAQTTLNIYTHVTQKAKEEAILKFANYIEM